MSCEISSAVSCDDSYSAAIHTSPASSRIFLPIACLPAFNRRTVPDSGSLPRTFRVSSSNNSSKRFIYLPARLPAVRGSSVLQISIFQPSPGFDQCPVKLRDSKAEFAPLPVCRHDKTALRQIRFHPRFFSGEFRKQPIDFRIFQLNRHHAAVEHVLPKNAGKALGNHQVDTVYLERPGRMLPGGAAAEIGAGDKNGLSRNI